MKKLKTVLIGCGIIATVHTDVLKKLDIPVAAVCDVDEGKARQHCREYGLNAKIYTDYKAMLDSEKPDVAHVLTPHYLHAEMVVEVLSRGIHCLCEKPLYIKKEEYPKIKAAADRSSAMLGVCFQHRYIRRNQYVKEQIEKEGFLGAAAFQAWHKDADYYASGAWRGKYDTEGGALLINQAIHFVDQLVWLGGMPSRITANLATHTLGHCIEAEDTAELFFDYGGGVCSQLYATNSAAANFVGSMHLKTSKANYEWDARKIYRNEESIPLEAQIIDIDTKSYWGYGHYNLIHSFYQCVCSGEKFPIDCREGAKAVEIVLAAMESQGKPVKIGENDYD